MKTKQLIFFHKNIIPALIGKIFLILAGRKYDNGIKNKKHTTPLPYLWDVG